MKNGKLFFTAVLCAASAMAMADAPEELLYFPFDENIQPEVFNKGGSVVGHIGATVDNGGFNATSFFI